MPRLTPQTRAHYGVPDGWNFGIETRVQWRDVDMLAHAHHLSYLAHCEDVRSEYQAEVGLLQSGTDHPSQVIACIRAQYHGSLAFRDDVLVATRTVRLGRSSSTAGYAVWKDSKCLFSAEMDLVLYDLKLALAVPLADSVRERIRLLDPAVVEGHE